jgi:hypothetical protein
MKKNVPDSHGEESSSGVAWRLVARLAFHLTRGEFPKISQAGGGPRMSYPVGKIT